MAIKKQPYTVIGFWADNQQGWVSHVNAENPDKAAIAGIKRMYNNGKTGG